VLEAARLFDVEKVMFASSGSTFSLALGEETTDTTIQRPTTFYGIGKLYGEGLGRYYRTKFGLDFRTVRYPVVTGPGFIKNWYIGMIEAAVLGRSYECKVTADSTLPTIMFIKDAARAADMILQAPKEDINMVNYNVAGVPPPISPGDIERAIKKYIPNFAMAYKPDPTAMALQRNPSATKSINDSYARKEWGWDPVYTTIDQVVAAFIDEMRAHPERYL